MALPPVEPLFEHLCALRDAPNPTDPQHDARWKVIARWLEQAFPGRGQENEDARQEALVALMRNVPLMRAHSPLQAAKWIATIVRRKKVDAHRARTRDPVEHALKRERRFEDLPRLVDRLTAEEPPRDTPPEVLDVLVATVLDHVHRALEATEPNIARRHLYRTQAQATLLRLVCAHESDAIEAALDYGEPIGKDRLYKWVERGRGVVAQGLDRWEREDPRAADVVEALREIVAERRADAGVPRPERRRERGEDA